VKRFTVLILCVLLSLAGSAQTYRFSKYDVADGLIDKFTYTINQDLQGFLWIGTGQGLCRFDGKAFEQDFRGDTIPLSIAHATLLDSRGRLWFGHENGFISVRVDGVFSVIAPPVNHRSKITAIREDPYTGNILVLCQQSGVLIIDEALQIIHAGDPGDPDDPFVGKTLYDFQVSPEGHLLVGTEFGISIFRFDTELETYIETGQIPDLMDKPVQELVRALEEEEYWAGTQDEGVFRITGNGYDPAAYQVEKLGEGTGIEYADASFIIFDGDRRVWINSYGVGIYRFDLDLNGNLGASQLFDVEGGLPDKYISQIFIDEEGNQWFSSLGNGMGVLRNQAFTFYSVWEEEEVTEVFSIYVKGSDQWFGGQDRIAHKSGTGLGEYTYLGPENGLPNDTITALYQDSAGDLYIGTKENGLYRKRNGSTRITSLISTRNSLQNSINAIDGHGDSLFVATNDGVYTLNPANGRRTFRNTTNGLPHNMINDILVDDEGVAWIATKTSGLWSMNSDKQFLIEGKPKIEFMTLEEGEDGVIWAGTFGHGVFRFNFNDQTLTHFGVEDGLHSAFTYAIAADPLGNIWVGHRMGLSCIYTDRDVVQMYGKESGFESDVNENAVALISGGKMLIGSMGGVIQYDAYQAREDTVAPRLSFKRVELDDELYDPTQEIKINYGRYRLRVDFVGINLNNPEQVSYSYKLDGYEEEWSEFSDASYATYGVVDGKYTFMLRACDGNGNCSTTPLTLGITIKIPIWKAWWFIASAVLAVLATIFIIFKIRERNQKAIQEYLQRQLDERTREVVQQKEEIEVKNRDITDSLNYAQRIQASILPPIKKLHEAFTGSFVFYQPRDIVSGDFYWYEQVDENRFIVVCADSTGHGVPGAFMSMIGTTLIKDICLRSGVVKPSQVLTTLDNEVREALNQNVETTGSNDGMDIIVAEVDMRTFMFTVSSAMRPVIIYSGGEQIYVKGSRSSIGGQLDEDRTEKDFIDQEFKLSKGDIVYMFSDGYPDQFGGPLGRKFKMVRLKNLLRDIHDKPMDEQYNYIKSNFFLWKEDLEQVDDVLFMGIRL
jgi:ligand-binding sensor domain-containing protein/serine phosphatase RsbU (regulator of sigma subunit)